MLERIDTDVDLTLAAVGRVSAHIYLQILLVHIRLLGRITFYSAILRF